MPCSAGGSRARRCSTSSDGARPRGERSAMTAATPAAAARAAKGRASLEAPGDRLGLAGARRDALDGARVRGAARTHRARVRGRPRRAERGGERRDADVRGVRAALGLARRSPRPARGDDVRDGQRGRLRAARRARAEPAAARGRAGAARCGHRTLRSGRHGDGRDGLEPSRDGAGDARHRGHPRDRDRAGDRDRGGDRRRLARRVRRVRRRGGGRGGADLAHRPRSRRDGLRSPRAPRRCARRPRPSPAPRRRRCAHGSRRRW